MKTTLLLLLTPYLFFAQAADSAGKHIAFAYTRYTLGTLANTDYNSSCVFPFRNTGPKPINMLNYVAPSPLIKCYDESWNRPVKPGERGSITISFDDKFLGSVNGPVTVTFNCGLDTFAVPLYVDGYIHRDTLPEFQFDSLAQDGGTYKNNSDVSFTFSFKNISKNPAFFTDAYSNGVPIIQWPKDAVLPGKTGTLKVSYPGNRTGTFNSIVTVVSNTRRYILSYKGTILAPE